MIALLDDHDRQGAIRERERNVVVTASAGTGKTSLIVERLLEMVAPTDDREPVAIERIAAITFTRKAAGELRVRVRQRILQALSALPPEAPRAAPLRRALDGIDTALIGTIHSFADRLLRKWPSQAQLDPRYALDDRSAALVDECCRLLVHAAERRTLDELLRGSQWTERSGEATATILDAQRAGLRLRSLETEHWTYHGLDGLVTGFITHRDVEPIDPPAIELDRDALLRFAGEYLSLTEGISSGSPGGRWLADTRAILSNTIAEADPALIFRELVDRIERGPRGRTSDPPRFRDDFGGDERAWGVWKALDGDERQKRVRIGSLRDDLLGPLRRWMAHRLVRLRPVVLQLYEQVKARHRAVDHVDLLLRLRNLLRDEPAIRRSCQALFDHIFVDELQDTDPLQAEIVMFLCERGAEAVTWDTVNVAPGTLTVVGDPKQSIYRFRRADIGTYVRVIEIISRSPHLAVRLTSSFRSAPGLVAWLNDRFTHILDTSDAADAARETGEVRYQPLTIGRTSGSDPTIHAVRIDPPEGDSAADCRALEAEVMSRYLRWLVEVSNVSVADPLTGEVRRAGYGDIGVLAIATTRLPVLFDAFDRDGIPYASRGGTLFLGDPLHRRFLLGLAALADRDDGVAVAALLRPPFFAVDLADLARSRPEDPDDRVVQARAVVRELRRRRFERGPGATARALLEETGFGRTIALGANGAQRTGALRELCFRIEAKALDERLDFDATMGRVREWVDHPRGMDRPHPIGTGAVRVMTIHQAKGLEFPIVVLWDARATWKERVNHDAWTVERDGHAWAVRLDKLRWEEPVGSAIVGTERKRREAERKRLVYVAATRARDILVIPNLGAAEDRWIFGRLLGGGRSPTVIESARHARQAHAVWFDRAAPPEARAPGATTERDAALQKEWQIRVEEVSREHLRPVAFTEISPRHALWDRRSRYGTAFGELVHVAIGLALHGVAVGAAVSRAAARAGSAPHLREAAEDVSRALTTLATLDVKRDGLFELEYPVAGVLPGGQLGAGYADLVAMVNGDIILLDFKTDAPASHGEILARYVDQVRGYADVLERALDRPVRAGLLFTADGGIRWLSSGDNA